METINASGNDASGSSGTVSYSIGQVFYTYIGASVYNVAQGIQQEENKVNLGTTEDVKPKIDISVYPNPTTDFVNINIEGYVFGDEMGTYQLYDFQGRLLKQNTIGENETQVSLNNLSSSIYILQVNINNKFLKTFKIIKK
ncbi:T9SS type A sorting domain-containing protein [Flavobacterium sp. WC2509]|uniref:T9SS type A sorting domain-containing protein n=1 Tax=Flavobacterium sp. WC2509 TaxID=3461406 RepID=UPI004043E18C